MNIHNLILQLIDYSKKKNLIDSNEEIYSLNLLLDFLKLDSISFDSFEKKDDYNIEILLDEICSWAIENDLIEDTQNQKELFDTKIMNCVTPRPATVINQFNIDYNISPNFATENYYNFSKNTNYIRSKRIEKNMHWYFLSNYGDLEITINLAKPEKDPKDIEKEKSIISSNYPKCLLCYENIGYAGRVNHPARQTHRVIPLNLGNEEWFLQFSPYVYYNEHSIIFSREHRPMKISKQTFKNLLDFLDIFPHYFIGSNADLPIVGGSILSHEHYQAGSHILPLAKANIEKYFKVSNFEEVQVGIVNWPMSVIRITSNDKSKLIEFSDHILKKWQNYSDFDCDVHAYSNDTPHNTITPIARKIGNLYQLDLTLRNNRTTDRYQLGLFHPHNEVHHIKKENIGLIEVMGLAILPGRLKIEMENILSILKEVDWKNKIKNDSSLNKHYDWLIKLSNKYQNNLSFDILQKEIGEIFSIVLEHSGVFKRDSKGKNAFEKFINIL